MALSYFYTFSTPKSVPATELESFLKTIEQTARKMGFSPTFVMNGSFSSNEQKKFARRITHGLLVSDPRLKGATLLDTSQVWNYDQERGECRVIPERGVLLIVTDEQGCEVIFGFLWYPDILMDLNGKELASVPHKGHWYFHDFVDSPDRRYRDIVRMFAKAEYVESENDEYAAS